VHFVFHGVAVAEVGDPDLIAGLAVALDSALELLQAGSIPGKVNLDQGAEPLQVEAFLGGISSEQQLDLTTADSVFQHGAVTALETAAQLVPPFAQAWAVGS